MNFEHLVIFDIDSTLLRSADSYDVFARVYHLASGRSLNDTLDIAAQPELVILEQILQRCAPQSKVTLSKLARMYHDQLRVAYAKKPPVALAGARELLQSLAHEGAQVIFATGNSRNVAQLKLDFSGISQVLAASKIALKGGFGDQLTSKVEIASAALKEWQEAGFVARRRSIIGDSPSDMRAGRSLGLNCVGVCTGAWPRDDLLAAGANIVLDDLSDVASTLRALLQVATTGDHREQSVTQFAGLARH